MKKTIDRRGFLGKTAAAATLSTMAFNSAKAYSAGNANDTVNLGLIGCGCRGSQLIKSFKPIPGVRFTAVCDLNEGRMAAAQEQVGGTNVRGYQDFRKLIDDKNVDAVVIATNGHWKALPTIYACQAGKDVYVEKPLATSIGEGRVMVEAAKKYNRIVQIGTQQHSLDHYRKAVKIIQSGRLGRISEVKVWDYLNQNPGIGAPADSDPPKGFDWDFWVGPSPKVPYNRNRLKYHYWFFDYGGAWTADWAVHHYDIVHWAMGTTSPRTAMAGGGHYCFDEDNREWPDTFSGILEYGPCPAADKGFVLQYTYRTGNQHDHYPHSNAKCFFGTDATLFLHRAGYTLTPEIRGSRKVKSEKVTFGLDNDGPHQKAFIDNLRNRTQPETDALVGHYASIPGHLMNLAWRVGHKIQWDAEKEQVVGDPAANALVTKNYRAPWKLAY